MLARRGTGSGRQGTPDRRRSLGRGRRLRRAPDQSLHDAVAQPEGHAGDARGELQHGHEEADAAHDQSDVGAQQRGEQGADEVGEALDPHRAQDRAGDGGDAAEDHEGDEG